MQLNNIKLIFLMPLLIMATLLPTLTSASTPNAKEVYEIEVIVFTRPGNASQQNQSINQQVDENALKLTNAISLLPYDELAPQTAYRLLPLDALKLNKEADKINKQPGYQVISHIAWLQPIPASRRGTTVRLSSSQSLDEQLIGTVTISKNRYINVAANVLLNYTYQLKEKRRMRSDELNYFDSPSLGILVKVETIAPSQS